MPARPLVSLMLPFFACQVLLLSRLAVAAAPPQPLVLKANAFRHYVDAFNQHDNELYVRHVPNAAAWEFLKTNIPLLDCPDKDIEEIYYFRWWTFRKAIRQTPDGFVVTEFLPTVGWAGKHNSINCTAGHHLHEGRWVNDPKYLDNYFDLLKIYTKSHRLKRADGRVVPWIDENLNPSNGDWISRTRLRTWNHGTWDAGYKPYAIFDGQKWLLWYNGRHGSLEQIGVVLHEGEDLGFPTP